MSRQRCSTRRVCGEPHCKLAHEFHAYSPALGQNPEGVFVLVGGAAPYLGVGDGGANMFCLEGAALKALGEAIRRVKPRRITKRRI